MIAQFRFNLLVLCVAVMGCSNSNSPSGSSTNNSPDSTKNNQLSGPAAFRVIVGHDTIYRTNSAATYGAIATYSNTSISGQPGGNSLFIQLQYTPASLYATTVTTNIDIPISGAVVKSYPVMPRNSPDGVSITIDSAMQDYNSRADGTFTITKFDTVMNLVSGTFRFTASPNFNPSEIDTIIGAFNDVGISNGTFGQGSISAIVDAQGYHPDQISISMTETNGLSLDAVEGNPPVYRTLQMQVKDPKVGLFPFAQGTTAGTANVEFDQQASVMLQVRGNMGTLNITSFDTVTRRISATFSFSGTDTRTGRTVSTTNGSINNLQWFIP
ncbi:MAG: DUF6252 family protein [Bacteroidota bacterium]|nr:DUF6252 family protein [Bacteroidota bacterium]MDP4233435.1 DUF6252 family protein [Bacteroidota bacterium]MDP4242301.1 DUF6252 family protein [Bacteroidota bacterium]MDP4287057.1 DUF6252 family protein [Bacteroidota bacterium]